MTSLRHTLATKSVAPPLITGNQNVKLFELLREETLPAVLLRGSVLLWLDWILQSRASSSSLPPIAAQLITLTAGQLWIHRKIWSVLLHRSLQITGFTAKRWAVKSDVYHLIGAEKYELGCEPSRQVRMTSCTTARKTQKNKLLILKA